MEGTGGGGGGGLFTCGAETVKNKWLSIETLHTDRPFSVVWESMSTYAVIIVQTQVKGCTCHEISDGEACQNSALFFSF